MKQRLQVIIAHAGLTSRRKAEELIAHGNVQVNGKTISIAGSQADADKDTIIVSGKKISGAEPKVYFLLHKTAGTISTVSDPDQKRTVLDVFRRWWKREKGTSEIPRVYPVGRLDEISEGLTLLTNDGDLSYRLTHPKFEIHKKYMVLVSGSPSNTQLKVLQVGIPLKEGYALADEVAIASHELGNTWITITIHQGMNHQIRRMCSHVGLEVIRLRREQLGEFRLDGIAPGKIKEVYL